MSHKEILGNVPEQANEQALKKKQALDNVEAMLYSFSENTRFQYALSKENCIRAIKHWTGVERLEGDAKAQLFDDVDDDYHEVLLPAMQAMKRMEAHCRAAERPFPIVEFLAGESRLRDRYKQEEKIEDERIETIQNDMYKYKKHGWGLAIGMQLLMMGFTYFQLHYGSWSNGAVMGRIQNSTALHDAWLSNASKDPVWEAQELHTSAVANGGHEVAPNDELRRLRRLPAADSRTEKWSRGIDWVWSLWPAAWSQ
mmetsp:Transcript_67133/g.119476  ORF Transcript_67133/g.119476 Transcript_67133/m.119476 type:complete len:255 (+) Transcript_67133:96-860(+)